MLPALKNVVFEKDRPMPIRSSNFFGSTYAQGTRSPPTFGGASSTSCQAGSRWRSYQAAYSSTIARVAGWVVTSSAQPSPMTQTLRPSRRASRYSSPVLMSPVPSSFHDDFPCWQGKNAFWFAKSPAKHQKSNIYQPHE